IAQKYSTSRDKFGGGSEPTKLGEQLEASRTCANDMRQNKCPARTACQRGKVQSSNGFSEDDLHPELEDPRFEGRSDLAKFTVAEVGADVMELGVVPRVEAFCTELQPAAPCFAKEEALEKREVPVIAARSPEGVVAQRTEGTDCRGSKRGRIEPLGNRVGIRDATGQVWPVRGSREAVAALVAAESDVDRQT